MVMVAFHHLNASERYLAGGLLYALEAAVLVLAAEHHLLFLSGHLLLRQQLLHAGATLRQVDIQLLGVLVRSAEHGHR